MSAHETCIPYAMHNKVTEERDRLRDGMLALLGGDDYLTEYECGHGTPIGSPCFSDCHLNPTRIALGIAGHIEE